MVAAGLCTLVILATGVLPAVVATRSELAAALRGGRTIAGAGRLGRAQGVLVVVQGSVSLMLLVGAGLLLRSFVTILEQPASFRTEQVGVVTVQIWDYYPDGEGRASFVRDVAARLCASSS